MYSFYLQYDISDNKIIYKIINYDRNLCNTLLNENNMKKVISPKIPLGNLIKIT